MPFLIGFSSLDEKYYFKCWNYLLRAKYLNEDGNKNAADVVLSYLISSSDVQPIKVYNEVAEMCAALSNHKLPYSIDYLNQRLRYLSLGHVRCIVNRGKLNTDFLSKFKLEDEFVMKAIKAFMLGGMDKSSCSKFIIFVIENYPHLLTYEGFLLYCCEHTNYRNWLQLIPARSLKFKYSLHNLAKAFIQYIKPGLHKEVKNHIVLRCLSKLFEAFTGLLINNEESKPKDTESSEEPEAVDPLVIELNTLATNFINHAEDLSEIIGLKNKEVIDLFTKYPYSNEFTYVLRSYNSFAYTKTILKNKLLAFYTQIIQKANSITSPQEFNSIRSPILDLNFESEEVDEATNQTKKTEISEIFSKLKPKMEIIEVPRKFLSKEFISIIKLDKEIESLLEMCPDIVDCYNSLLAFLQTKQLPWLKLRIGIISKLIEYAASSTFIKVNCKIFEITNVLIPLCWKHLKSVKPFKDAVYGAYSTFLSDISMEYIFKFFKDSLICKVEPITVYEILNEIWDTLPASKDLMIKVSTIKNNSIKGGIVKMMIENYGSLNPIFQNKLMCDSIVKKLQQSLSDTSRLLQLDSLELIKKIEETNSAKYVKE